MNRGSSKLHTTISMIVDSFSIHLTFNEIPDIDLLVCINHSSLSSHLVRPEFTFEFGSRGIDQDPMAIFQALFPLTLELISVTEVICTVTTFFSIYPLAIVFFIFFQVDIGTVSMFSVGFLSFR